MHKIKVKSKRFPYIRGGVRFKDSQAVEVEVNNKELQALKADSFVTIIEGGGKNKPFPQQENTPPPEELTIGQKFIAVKTAIAGLDKNVKENWTANGAPQVAAIEAVVGFNIDGKLRDKAWGSVSKAEN